MDITDFINNVYRTAYKRWVLYILAPTINSFLAIPAWRAILESPDPVPIYAYVSGMSAFILFFVITPFFEDAAESSVGILLGMIGTALLPILYQKGLIGSTGLISVASTSIIVVALLVLIGNNSTEAEKNMISDT